MATRALIVVYDDFNDREMVTIYKHWDGYPEAPGLGATLAEFLANIRLVNGLPLGDKSSLANGMDCLAAQIVAFLKEEAGDVYLQATGTRDMGEEYVYHVLPPEEGDPEVRPRLFVWDVRNFSGSTTTRPPRRASPKRRSLSTRPLRHYSACTFPPEVDEPVGEATRLSPCSEARRHLDNLLLPLEVAALAASSLGKRHRGTGHQVSSPPVGRAGGRR